MRVLTAGPLKLLLDGPDLRSIRIGDREVLRRVYVAVRNRNWNTIGGEVRNLTVEQEGDGTLVRFECVHRLNEIDFRWNALIRCRADGVIRFEMNGRAHSTFLRNRIGICVHHPLRETVGRKCVVETSQGRREDVFPFYVAPHQPFLELKSIAHEVEPGVKASVSFEGDLFEMEDHRNWTDGGFKTYSTPLNLPYPVEVKEGTEVRQAVEIRVQLSSPGEQPEQPVALKPGAGAVRQLPPIGFGLGPWPDGDELALLRALQPAHLRLDCELWSDCHARLERAAALGVPIELALHLSDNGDSELRAHLAALKKLPLARVLVFHRAEKVTPPRWLTLVRSLLGGNVVGGTNAYFAELNRNRPEDKTTAYSFSLNPQVHAFDNLSLMENLEAQAHVIQSGRMFLGTAPLIVSPVSLLPRFNADATEKPAKPQEPPADPRQREAFCAAWTAGSLKYLCEAGASSVTYYEAAGPRGLMGNGSVYPVYRVFEAMAPFAGGQCVPVESSAPLQVLGLGLRKQSRSRLILANLTGQAVRTVGWQARALAPYEVAVIDDVRELI